MKNFQVLPIDGNVETVHVVTEPCRLVDVDWIQGVSPRQPRTVRRDHLIVKLLRKDKEGVELPKEQWEKVAFKAGETVMASLTEKADDVLRYPTMTFEKTKK